MLNVFNNHEEKKEKNATLHHFFYGFKKLLNREYFSICHICFIPATMANGIVFINHKKEE
jgi:hypothetical protein